MREIKFRAWDNQNDKMLFSKEHKWIGREEEFYPIRFERDQITHSDHYELMQYTGLKDKNGKEIYEGDILRWTQGAMTIQSPVQWADKGWFPFVGGIYDLYKRVEEGEIIGNIYENPDLLKK